MNFLTQLKSTAAMTDETVLNIVDLGCGTGYFSPKAQRLFSYGEYHLF